MFTITDIDKTPLQHIGRVAGTCWGADVSYAEGNVKRAKSCIKAGHGRVMEYINIEMVIEKESARMIRELYTHIIGTTRLQESTRYCDASTMEAFIPPKIAQNDAARDVYNATIDIIKTGYAAELGLGIPKEDAANMLPLGMHSKMVLKINLRAMVHFMNMRLCSRAYHEIRKFCVDLKKELSDSEKYGDEWKWIAESLFVPNCEVYKFRNPNMCFCTEQQCCGRHPKLEDCEITAIKKD